MNWRNYSQFYILILQLVSVLTGDSPLSPAQLEEAIKERGKGKSLVTVVICNGHVKVQRTNLGKPVRIQYHYAFIHT